MFNHFNKIIILYNPKRMMSVDLLRGFTIFAMILVNNPGSWGNIYPPLAHAEWHGWTITDLVFPFFLFIVGLSIALSADKAESNINCCSLSKPIGLNSDDFIQIVVRTIKLIILGWILGVSYYNFYDPNFEWFNDRLLSIRWFGVLQRIALVYFVCAICFRILTHRQLILLSILLLAIYWGAMILIPYSDDSGNQFVGLLLPGNNLAAYIDHHLFGVKHLYHKSTLPFASDPEGLLTTLPAVVNGLIGVLVAKIILNNPCSSNQNQQPEQFANLIKSELYKLLLVGFIMLIAAFICALWFPINKNLWSPSYVLLSSGLAILCLAFARWLIEFKKINQWAAPFLVFGNNAIALFMLSGFAARLLSMIKIDGISLKGIVYSGVEVISNDAQFNSLCFAILFMLVMYWPLYWMYKNKIFWKV